MKFRITHTTLYEYSQSAGLCQNEARLQPRDFWRQQCLSSHYQITPKPVNQLEREDFFGNRVAYFAVQQPHLQLDVTAISEVMILPRQTTLDLFNQESWEQIRDSLQETPMKSPQQWQELIDARQYILDSPMVITDSALAEYAQPSFLPGRPLLEAVSDLTRRIFTEFTYDPSFTTIATPLADVLAHRRGVCQDFAHLAIGCLRSFGLAARYISGYIETLPAPGQEKLVGTDASHAWFAVYIPGSGWLEFDPTNNQSPYDQHITLAWGRDFSDVTPLKGIAYGGGEHQLSVYVDVHRLEA